MVKGLQIVALVLAILAVVSLLAGFGGNAFPYLLTAAVIFHIVSNFTG